MMRHGGHGVNGGDDPCCTEGCEGHERLHALLRSSIPARTGSQYLTLPERYGEGFMASPRVGAFLAALLVAATPSGTAYGAAATPDFSGIYWATEYNARIQVVGGGELPLTPAGKTAYDKNIGGLK